MRQDSGGVGGAALVVWLPASGGLALAGGALPLATILEALWLRRRGWRLARAANTDCCAPAEPAHSEVAR